MNCHAAKTHWGMKKHGSAILNLSTNWIAGRVGPTSTVTDETMALPQFKA